MTRSRTSAAQVAGEVAGRRPVTIGLSPLWVQYSGVTVAARAAAELLADLAEHAPGDELPALDREFIAYHLDLGRADRIAPVLAELEAIGFLTIHGDLNPLTGKRRRLRNSKGLPVPDRFSVALHPPAEYGGPQSLQEIHAQFVDDREAAYQAAKTARKRARRGSFVIRRGAGTPSGTYLYVVGPTNSGRVKIGITTDTLQRLKALQASSPALLRLLWWARGSREMEERLHLRFHSYRTHGEWFDFGERADPVAAVRAEALRLGAVEVPV